MRKASPANTHCFRAGRRVYSHWGDGRRICHRERAREAPGVNAGTVEAVLAYRVARELHVQGLSFLPSIVTGHAAKATIEADPGTATARGVLPVKTGHVTAVINNKPDPGRKRAPKEGHGKE